MAVGLAVFACSCAERGPEPVSVTWAVGQHAPAFDPQGPPDAVRWSLERLLARGLVEEDSSGRIVPAAAESVGVSSDGLRYTFRLRSGLAFADGAPATSAHFGEAIRGGLNRLDHGTYAWLLGTIAGMERARAGRPLPADLGIETPDPRTLVIELARPEPTFLARLATPGAAVPWRKNPSGEWSDGLGDYRLLRVSAERWILARQSGVAGPDTIHVRFGPGTARGRSLLRAGVADLLWPAPPDLFDRPLPEGYERTSRPARPERLLMLVMRADLPPTSRPAGRHALAHGMKVDEVLAGLGRLAQPVESWLPGAPAFEPARQDPGEVQSWLERGNLGRSLHVVMAYSTDGLGQRVARSLQVEWARLGLDVELRPLRQSRMADEALRRGGAQLLLMETQPLLDSPEAHLASLALPLRGPSVGAFRSGWSTREFDAWTLGRDGDRADLATIQLRLGEEQVAIPLARLPWIWVTRAGARSGFHPRFGPDPRGLTPVPLREER